MTHKTHRKLGKERLNALTEGVYAVVMTLMLLSVIEDIQAPGIDINHLPEILVTFGPSSWHFSSASLSRDPCGLGTM